VKAQPTTSKPRTRRAHCGSRKTGTDLTCKSHDRNVAVGSLNDVARAPRPTDTWVHGRNRDKSNGCETASVRSKANSRSKAYRPTKRPGNRRSHINNTRLCDCARDACDERRGVSAQLLNRPLGRSRSDNASARDLLFKSGELGSRARARNTPITCRFHGAEKIRCRYSRRRSRTRADAQGPCFERVQCPPLAGVRGRSDERRRVRMASSTSLVPRFHETEG